MKVLIVFFVFMYFINTITSKEYENNTEKFTTGLVNTFFNIKPSELNMTTADVNKEMKHELNKRYNSRNIILRNIKGNRKMGSKKQDNNFIYSTLTGNRVPIESFTHNNMTPFFGGSIKQSMNDTQYATKLENFTGVSDDKCEKTGTQCFTDLHRNINDQVPEYITRTDRIDKPKLQNNVLPTEQLRVGPGYNSKDPFSSKPSGGFNQNDIAYNANMYKSIDETRVKSNPRVTYEGTLIEGSKELKRAEITNIKKNRVETYYEQNEDNLFKTTGAITKERMKPCVDVKNTTRQSTVKEYKGIPFDSKKAVHMNFKTSGNPKKQHLQEYGMRNASIADGNGTDDYGKENIRIKRNERDITTTKTRTGNLTKIIKALITPVQDVLQPNKKTYCVETKRDFQGNVNGMNKQTIYDPTGVARTTIKETTIHDGTTGNMKVNKGTIVYDPTDLPKRTVKEVLRNYDNDLNLKGSIKPSIHNKEPITTTIKEVTEDSNRDGNIGTTQKSDAYMNSKFTAKNTNKELTTNNDYFGMPENTNSDAYRTIDVNAKNTQKEMLSDNDYFGTGKNDISEHESYEAVYNAVINDVKENVLEERVPTSTSVKLNSGTAYVNMTKERNDCDMIQYRDMQNFDRVRVKPPSKELLNIINKSIETESDRLDETLVSQFKKNPLSQSLHSSI